MPSGQAERQAISAYVGGHAGSKDISKNGRLFAAISSWVYERDDDTPGMAWRSPGAGIEDHASPRRLVPPPDNHSSGYDGGAFYHEESGTLILANRGSEDWRDWGTNVATKITGKSAQLDQALEYAARAVQHTRGTGLPVHTVVTTGHSLGGGLAQVQFACLNAVLTKKVPTVYGYGTASAPFGNAARALRAGKGGGDLVPPESDGFQTRVCPTDPITLAGASRIGQVVNDLPEVWTVFFNAASGQPKALGELRYNLDRYRNPAHSAYRYFEHWDTGAGRCIVVSHKGEELVIGRPSLPDGVNLRFNNFNRAWAALKKYQ